MAEVEKKPLDYRQIARLEYEKCLKSPEYFITKYVYIQMTNGGRGKFILYEFQKKLLHLLHTKDRLIILKSRQLGITTLSAAYALWLMVFRKDQSILALAPDQEKARNILDKIHFAYDELPSWLIKLAGAEADEKAKLRMTLANGSRAVAASGASKSARGKTATFLVLDEAAFIENAEELWGSAQQTLASGGSAIMLSTPNGTGGLFYQLYTEAEEGDGEFVPVKLKWNVHPDRDQAWRDRQDKELGSKRMASQECDAEFLASGDTYIDTDILSYLRQNVEEPVEMRGPTKSYWIWKYPHEVGNCAVIVDTSRGDGADSSAIQVIELLTGDQIAEIKEDLLPKDLARIAVSVAQDYNKALLIVENTGIGHTTCSYVADSGYTNVFYSPKGDTRDVHAYLNKYHDQDQEDMIAGFTNSTRTRPLILSSMQQALIDRVFKVRSRRAVSELESFVWKKGKPQAANGKHDDLVITLAIGCHLRDTALNYHTHGVDITRSVLNNIQHLTIARPMNQINNYAQNPYEVINPFTGAAEDISWVL